MEADVEDDELVRTLDEAEDGSEVDRLDPVPDVLTLKCGIEVHLLPMRTRQLFKLLKIITHGAGSILAQSGLDFGADPREFLQKLLSVVLFSIPDAEQEAIDFLQSIVEPVDLVDKAPRDMTDAEREHNIAAWTELNTELWNPDPSDTIDIIEAVIRHEGDDLQALGKKVRQFLELAAKTGQLKSKPAVARASRAPNSPASSAASSTSSAASTGGRTSRSSTSPSAASGKSSRPSRRASGRTSATGAK